MRVIVSLSLPPPPPPYSSFGPSPLENRASVSLWICKSIVSIGNVGLYYVRTTGCKARAPSRTRAVSFLGVLSVTWTLSPRRGYIRIVHKNCVRAWGLGTNGLCHTWYPKCFDLLEKRALKCLAGKGWKPMITPSLSNLVEEKKKFKSVFRKTKNSGRCSAEMMHLLWISRIAEEFSGTDLTEQCFCVRLEATAQ